MRLRARLLSIVLILTMIMPSMVISASAASTAPTLTVLTDSTTVTPGGEVVVTVNMANNPGIVSMRLELNYDKDVFSIASLEDVIDAGILGTPVHNNIAAKHPYILSWQNGDKEENFTVNGDLVSVTFQVSEDAVEGESYEFSVSYDYDNVDIMNFDLKPVSFETVSATVTVDNGEPDPNAPALKVVETSGAAGEEVTVNIAIVNNPGLAGLNFQIEFDTDALEYVSAKLVCDDFVLQKNEIDNNYKYVFYSSYDVVDDCDILALTFKIKDGVDEGEYAVTVTPYGKCVNEAEAPIVLTSINGAVTVVNFIPGDVNSDGAVDTGDLVRLAKFIAEVPDTVLDKSLSDLPDNMIV